MKFSQMFELKGPTQKNKKKAKKMPHEVFMGIMFLVCALIQLIVFELLEIVYGLPRTNTIMEIVSGCAIWPNVTIAMFCFGDQEYKNKRSNGIIIIVITIAMVAFIALLTIVRLIEGDING